MTKENEDRLIHSLLIYANDTARKIETENSYTQYYGLDHKDIFQEVLLAYLQLSREWRPREIHEGRMDEEEASPRTYCYRWGKDRALGNIQRKYGRNLRHASQFGLKVSNACVSDDARTDEPQFLKDGENERRERITHEIVQHLYELSDSEGKDVMDLLKKEGITHQMIANALGLKDRHQVYNIKRKILNKFLSQITKSGENIKCNIYEKLKELDLKLK